MCSIGKNDSLGKSLYYDMTLSPLGYQVASDV